MRSVIRLLIACFFGATILPAAQYYVAPGAPASGNGSLQNPWSLQLALNNSVVKPGDTIWLRGGTYFPPSRLSRLSGTNAPDGGLGWTVTLSGSADNLVTLRSYTNEWAKIDRPWRGTGQYLRFRDLEFYDSLKGFDPGVDFAPPPRPWSHFDGSGNNKHEFINCVLHDVNNVWAGGVVAKVRGCIIWHAGNQNLEHVTYSAFANQDTDEYSGNISYWPSGQVIELGNPGLTIASNIMAGAGVTVGAESREILFVESGSVIGNCTYDKMVTSRALDSGGNTGMTNNVLVSVGPVKLAVVTSSFYSNIVYMVEPSTAYASVTLNGNPSSSISADYNAYYSANTVRFEQVGTSWDFTQWRTNGFDAHSTAADATAPPDLVRVFPNADQPKRAHIAIYNWTLANNVTVSLSGVLSAGDNYQLYSAQNYGAGPIRTGTYNGSSISVPMTNLTAAPFLYTSPNHDWGLIAPSPTSPEFGAFAVIGSATKTLSPPPNFHVIPQ